MNIANWFPGVSDMELLLLLLNLFEQDVCSLIVFRLLGNIRPERKKLFWFTFVFTIFWGLLRMSMVLRGIDREIASKFAISIIFLTIITLYGMTFEGGMLQALFIIQFLDLSMSAVTVGLELLASFYYGIPFAQLFSDTGKSYSPSMLILFLVTYLTLLYLGRGWLKRFRDTPVESYPVLWFIGILFLIIDVSPIVYLVAIPAYSKAGLDHITWMFLLMLAFFLFSFYHIRIRTMYRQNLILRQQNQLIENTLTLSQEQIVLTRKLRHDIRRHLNVLTWSGSDTEGVEAPWTEVYRRNLEKMYEALQTGEYCGNKDVNAILFSLDKYCRGKNIPCRIRLSQLNLSEVIEDKRMTVVFYIIYWVMQYCEMLLSAGDVCVEISGGTMAGNTRIRAAVKGNFGNNHRKSKLRSNPLKGHSQGDSVTDQLLNDSVKGQLRGTLGRTGSVEILSGTDSVSMEVTL